MRRSGKEQRSDKEYMRWQRGEETRRQDRTKGTVDRLKVYCMNYSYLYHGAPTTELLRRCGDHELSN